MLHGESNIGQALLSEVLFVCYNELLYGQILLLWAIFGHG